VAGAVLRDGAGRVSVSRFAGTA